jgi:ribosomal protein L33
MSKFLFVEIAHTHEKILWYGESTWRCRLPSRQSGEPEGCESEVGIDYVFGLGQNSRLLQLTQSTQRRASEEYWQKLQPVVGFFETVLTPSSELKKQAAALVKHSVWYCSFDYQTEDSWSCSRRVVAKIEYSCEEVKTRFVVTSLSTKKVPPGRLYTEKYCPRGCMENSLKEQKLDMKSDRTSTHTFAGNQLRLWFSSIAYILMNTFRDKCLKNTELKNATVGTIRTKLLKLGAIITVNSRRVLIAITSTCPYKDIFATAYNYLSWIPYFA